MSRALRLPGGGGKSKFPMTSTCIERLADQDRMKAARTSMGRISAWIRQGLALFWICGFQVWAAQYSAGITATPNPAILNQAVVFTIGVTNTSFSDFTQMLVTNTLPNSTGLQSATTTVGTVNTSIPGTVILNVGALASGKTATLSINFLASGLAPLTNILSITATASTNLAEIDTFVITNRTAVRTGTADIGVIIQGPVTNILVGDRLVYTAGITNAGPSGVVQTAIRTEIPIGFEFDGVSPTNLVYSFTNRVLGVSFPSLNAGTSTTFQFFLVPTTVGTYRWDASVNAVGNSDPVLTNNVTTLSVSVNATSTNQLRIGTVSPQQFDRQSGTMQQTVQIWNSGSNAVTGIRLVVSGLTDLFLDSVGTNQGNPYAYFPGTLAPGATVDLILHIFSPRRQPLTNLVFSAISQPGNIPALPTSASLVPDQSVWLAPGRFLLEFGSTNGLTYTVAYADNPSFTNAVVSQPSITALNSRTQWIDTGPPRTMSAPSNSVARFYKVFQNP